MLGQLEFTIRVALRLGALALFAVLLLVLLWALANLMRDGLRPSFAAFCATVALIGVIVTVQPAWRAFSHLGDVIAARTAPPPAPRGAFAVADATLTLAPIHGEGSAFEVRVWFPQNAPAGPRPLVLYAPGLGGSRDQNALLMAELASHGYVALAFDDLALDPAPAGETPEAAALREGLFDMTTRDAYEATLARSDARVAITAERARDILDRFTALTAAGAAPWGEVETARVAFAGFSFGGATAAEAALLDPRIAAIVNLDGALFGRAAQQPVRTPYLLIMSDIRAFVPVRRRGYEHLLLDREMARARAQAGAADSEVLEIRLSSHNALIDEYFGSTYFRHWLKLDPFTSYDIVRTRTVGFLTRHMPAPGVSAPTPAVEDVRLEQVFEYGEAAQ